MEDWPNAIDGLCDRKQAVQADECARNALISRRRKASRQERYDLTPAAVSVGPLEEADLFIL